MAGPLNKREVDRLALTRRCSPHSKNNVGKRMRNYLVQQVFRSAPANVSVKCSETNHGNHTDQHSPSFRELSKAVFCLIMPGDHQVRCLHHTCIAWTSLQ